MSAKVWTPILRTGFVFCKSLCSGLITKFSMWVLTTMDCLKGIYNCIGIRIFMVAVIKIWTLLMYVLRRNLKKVIQHKTVKYQVLPLSPLSIQRLRLVKRKTLVLDLDETLIHSHHDGATLNNLQKFVFIDGVHDVNWPPYRDSKNLWVSLEAVPQHVQRQTVRPGTPPDFVLRVTIDHHPIRFFVHKRPHVDFFLECVSQWYDLVVFTASMEIYGAAVADNLDRNRGILNRRYFRQHCTLELGSYTKDLSQVNEDLSSVFILDNSPGAYRYNPDNAIPIKSWFADPSDTALLNLLPMLDALRFVSDVRSILSRNLHLHSLW